MALFERNPGGAPANVAAAVSRLAGRAAFIGKVGEDMHGAYLKKTLDEIGVDTSGVSVDAGAFTTLAFVSLEPSGERVFSFARKPGADTCLTAEDIQPRSDRQPYPAFWFAVSDQRAGAQRNAVCSCNGQEGRCNHFL